VISGEPDAMLASLERIGRFAAGASPAAGRGVAPASGRGAVALASGRGAVAPAAGRRAASPAALLLGVHLEGPFLSPERAGTHAPDRLIVPDLGLIARFVATGPVTMVTLAPELDGALEAIALLRHHGVVVSLGHSNSTAAEAAAAIDAGATAVTHLFNAMSPVSSRAPGLAGLALADRRVAVQVIADGVHVAPELLAVAVNAALERLSLVTDATSLAGQPDGRLRLGEVEIELRGGVARRVGDGTIAGGASSLLDGLRRLAGLTPELGAALAAVTERPARLVGRTDVGHLRPGGPADVVVLDENLELRQVLLAGFRVGEGARP